MNRLTIAMLICVIGAAIATAEVPKPRVDRYGDPLLPTFSMMICSNRIATFER